MSTMKAVTMGSFRKAMAISVTLLVLLPGLAWAAPTANSVNYGKLGPGKEVLFALSYTGSPTSFTIVTNPAHGTLRPYGTSNPQYYYYKANTGYEGTDSFTWKCSDASGASNVATWSVTISAVPTANNQSFTVVTGGEVAVYLSCSDPVGDKAKTFTVLSGPAHGTLQTYLQKYGTNYPGYYFYKATAGYTGADSFTWKMNNGYYDSNTATVSITVNANTAPTANNSSVTIPSTPSNITLSVTHPDAGQTMTYTLVSGPSHGTLGVNSSSNSWTYTPVKDYVGGDSFTWKVSDGIASSNVATVSISVNAVVPVPLNDRVLAIKDKTAVFTAKYTGGSGYVCTITKSNPAHGTLTVSDKTFTYTPAAGYVGADSFTWKMTYGTNTTATVTVSLTVTATDTGSDWPMWMHDERRTGRTTHAPRADHLQWRRDMPAIAAGFTLSSDVRYEYCNEPVVLGKTLFTPSSRNDMLMAINTDTGAERWRFYADGPIRTAPAAGNGKVYFSSDDGCLYCLNATDGAVLWKKRGGPTNRKGIGFGRLISSWPNHSSPILRDGIVYFTSGIFSLEGVFVYALNADTGAEVWRNDSDIGQMPGTLSTGVIPLGTSGYKGGAPIGPSPQGYPVINDSGTQLRYPSGHEPLSVWNLQKGHLLNFVTGGKTSSLMWLSPSDDNYYGPTERPTTITTGSGSYGTTDAAALGVTGTPSTLLAADGKLFVVTAQGSIYCFGANAVANPPAYTIQTTPLLNTQDAWTDAASHILSASGISGTGIALVWGLGSTRLAEELVKQSSLTVDGYDADAAKVATLRNKLDAAGLYGARGGMHVGDPANEKYVPTLARLIVSENLAASGFSTGVPFVKNLYRTLRPNGGKAWLPTTTGEHAQLQAWVTEAGLQAVAITRDGNWSVMTRTGLPGGVASVRPPYTVLWYASSDNHSKYSGGARIIQKTDGTDGALPAGAAPAATFPNSLTGELRGQVISRFDGSCAGVTDRGNVVVGRFSTMGVFEKWTNWGSLHLVNARVNCGASGQYEYEDGALSLNGYGCGCPYAFRGNFAFVPIPEEDMPEQWFQSAHTSRSPSVKEPPIQKVGVNFGAPDNRTEQGVWWLCSPMWLGHGPRVPVEFSPASPQRHYHHASRITGGEGPKWVAGSAVSGTDSIRIELARNPVAAYCATAPAIDGQISDSCWNGSNKVALAEDYYAGVVARGAAYFRYDANNLYVVSQASGVHTLATDQTCLYLGSSKFSVSGTGVKDPTSVAWSAAVATAGSGSDTKTTTEMAIPWATLASVGIIDRNGIPVNIVGPGGRIRDYGGWQNGGDLFSHLYFDVPQGAMATKRAYRVKLHFAEIGGAAAGQRVFDVKLQGQTVLSSFDIAAQAGGQWKSVVRQFDVVAREDVTISFVRKVGEPMINGAEIVQIPGTWGNEPPVAVIQATPTSGNAPLTVAFSAAGSHDDNAIYKCVWQFGDGSAGAEGSWVSHTFQDPGVYDVRLYVVDSDGLASAPATQRITVGGQAPAVDFVCTIRASGGDYAKLSVWEAAIRSDLTASSSLVFAVSGRGTYSPAADDGQAVTFTGGGTGVLKHINLANAAYIVGCGGTIQAGPVTCASGSFTISNTGKRVGRVIADCYNDWPSGLDDRVAIAAGWTCNAVHHPIVRAAAGQKHSGKAKSGGIYTGFALVNSVGWTTTLSANNHTRLESLIVATGDSRITSVALGSSARAIGLVVSGAGGNGISVGPNSLAQNCIVTGSGITAGANWTTAKTEVYNCTVVGSITTPIGAASSGGIFVNNLVIGSIAVDSGNTVSYCATENGTAGAFGGEGNRVNQTFAFVDAANGDYHLSPTDTGARNWGTAGIACPLTTDIDGEERGTPWDIGADEAMGGSSNHPPVISTFDPATPFTMASGTTQAFAVDAWDADGDALSYSWKIDGAAVPVTGDTMSYSPAAADAGAHTIAVTVSDGKGGSVTQTWSVTVTAPANQAPTVATAAKAAPSPATGATTVLSVLGTDDGGEANLTYTWATTGTPPAAVAFSPNGTNAAKNTTATFTKAGSYSFQVTIKDAGNLTVTSSVNVTVNQTLTTVTASPASASVATGAAQQFAAVAKDQFNANLTTQPAFSWTASGGGTISSSGLFTAGTTAGGPYTVTASSGGKSGTASVTVTAVVTAPTITTQPASVTVTTGQTASFSVVASGTAPLSYQWRKNGTNISGATSSSCTTPATVMADNGATFSVVVSNSAGSVTSNEATLTVTASGGGTGLKGEYFDNMDLTALKLTRTDATVNFDWGGGSPDSSIEADSFSVRWTGQVQAQFSETYTFYTVSDDGVRLWVNGVQVINNWTNHAPTENSGTISLVAGQKYDLKMEYYENGGGAVAKLLWSSTSTAKQVVPQAQLYAASSATPPSITTQPASQTVTVGQTATFSVAASGTAPLSYQWQKNGVNISGATAASYTTPATTAADSGAKFKVVVTNSAGSVTSNEATLTVDSGAATGQVLITCDNGYTLYFNGVQVGTGNNWNSLQTYGVNLQSGKNVVAVKCTDAGGVAALLAEVRYGTTRAGTSASWKVSLTGPAGWETVAFDDSGWTSAKDYGTYGVAPWYTNVSGCPSDTPARWIWSSNNDADNEVYVRFSFDNGGSSVVPPSITTQPASAAVTVGQTATFSVAASGTAPLSYQWQKNGVNISGATSASYTTPATTAADSGAKFRVVVTNSAGSVTSSEATLTVDSGVTAGQVLITCDNGYTLYFNGQQVGTGGNWNSMQTCQVNLQSGKNVVAVKCTDAGGVAALLAEVRYGTTRAGTSASWKVSLTGPAGWETVAFDDSAWTSAKDYGTYGVAPWYTNVSGCPSDTPARWIWSSNNDADNTVYVRFSFDN
jgi:PKD repeat protein